MCLCALHVRRAVIKTTSLQCLKRYRIAKQIFELLRSDAKSEGDIVQLQRCILPHIVDANTVCIVFKTLSCCRQ